MKSAYYHAWGARTGVSIGEVTPMFHAYLKLRATTVYVVLGPSHAPPLSPVKVEATKSPITL